MVWPHFATVYIAKSQKAATNTKLIKANSFTKAGTKEAQAYNII
jgi:hypothetical protein